MSAAATQHQPPVIPPRPSRSQEADQAGLPKIPPRPIKARVERSVSPNPERFAPSPLNDTPFLSKSPNKSSRLGGGLNGHYNGDPIERSTSVDIPTVGEEGREYDAVADELTLSRSVSPEHTRTVGADLKLHAPKPSLPAVSAKQRVQGVTRTDSDKAAQFGLGIGRPGSDGVPTPSNRSLKKKASTTSQLSTSESHVEDEGIPEIGQQIPLLPNAGDVQAPSPAPTSSGTMEPPKTKHHSRKTSSRGLPPGSYGLHGHGHIPQDKLEKAYYDKHPDMIKKELTPHHYDRPTDFSMSSEDLNKIVHDPSRRASALGREAVGTPSEQIGWQAYEETASRMASPRPPSTKPQQGSGRRPSSDAGAGSSDAEEKIHVEDPGRRRSVMFSDEELPAPDEGEEHVYNAPILADDEVAKEDPRDFQPAVEPPPERRGSAFEIDPPHSRPTSRPTSIYRVESTDSRSAPLEDVQEYEPLFPEDEKAAKKAAQPGTKSKGKKKFPSADVWEDAPNSVHYTAEVSTPDLPEEKKIQDELEKPMEVPPREGETPAQAFARRQEELAEKESKNSESFLHRGQQKPTWIQLVPHVAQEAGVGASRPSLAQRFPSRDVWEDTPDSLQLETTVSTPQQDEESPAEATSAKPEIPSRPHQKPTVPGRPKPKSASPEEAAKPTISERPKPQVPARPAKASSAEEAPAPKTKPAVPARPVGGKIAALQAGFMSDLNKRLQLGPQAPKKEEPVTQDLTEEKEKAPLADARKGRARGPQRRAPAASSPSPAAAARSEEGATPAQKPTLTFSTTVTVFTIDPEEDAFKVPLEGETEGKTVSVTESKNVLEPEEKETSVAPPAAEPQEPATEEVTKDQPESKLEEPIEEKTQSLATNTAGETIVEAHIEEDDKQTVEPTEVTTTAAKA